MKNEKKQKKQDLGKTPSPQRGGHVIPATQPSPVSAARSAKGHGRSAMKSSPKGSAMKSSPGPRVQTPRSSAMKSSPGPRAQTPKSSAMKRANPGKNEEESRGSWEDSNNSKERHEQAEPKEGDSEGKG